MIMTIKDKLLLTKLILNDQIDNHSLTDVLVNVIDELIFYQR
jgi:hypothetical protein